MTQEPSTFKRPYFPALTGIRAIAAYLVFFHHLPFLFDEPLNNYTRPLFREMHIGVTIFFVLSGFLIYYAYHHYTIDRAFIVTYFRNRVARIYPVYFLVVSIVSYVNWQSGQSLNREIYTFFLQITFIKGFSDTYKFIGVATGWSLTVEETFYFMFPFFLLGFRRGGFWRYLGITYLMGIILYVIGTSVDYQSFFTPIRFMANYTFWGRAAEFFIGMFFAKYLITKHSDHDIPLTNSYKKTLVGIIGIVCCLVALAITGVVMNSGFGIFTPQGVVINTVILPIFIISLFWGLITEDTIIRSFLGTKTMQLLGRSSYALYLIHFGLLSYHFLTMMNNNFTFHNNIDILIYFVFVSLISILIFLFIEEPMNQFIRNPKQVFLNLKRQSD